MRMKRSIKWKSDLLHPIRNERGSGQIISWSAAVGILLFVILFALEVSRFIITASEQNDLSDSIMRDSMRVHNGLTPATISLLNSKFAAKGFDTGRLSISGTPAAVPFGTEMQGTIVYDYHLPLFSLANSFFPSITVSTQPIRTEVYALALGVIR